jgi:hypothetical protein
VSLCIILTPQLKAPYGVISPTNGIKAHGGGVRQGGKVMKKFLSQMEREHVVPFAVGAGTGGACTWSPHKCTSHKASPIKPTQRSWKKTQQRELPMGSSSKNNDAAQGSHG